MFHIVSIHTKFHMPDTNGSLVIIIKITAIFERQATYVLHKQDPNKSWYFWRESKLSFTASLLQKNRKHDVGVSSVGTMCITSFL